MVGGGAKSDLFGVELAALLLNTFDVGAVRVDSAVKGVPKIDFLGAELDAPPNPVEVLGAMGLVSLETSAAGWRFGALPLAATVSFSLELVWP